LLPRSTELIYDLDDAVFMRTAHEGWRSRVAQPELTRLLVQRAAVTYAGNEYLAEYARRFCSNVRIVPTVLDTERFAPAPKVLRAKPLVGWVGSPSTSKYLERVMPALEQLAKRAQFTLRLVGAGRDFSVPNVEVDNRPWREEDEVREFQELDVGLYPLFDDAWSRGKCGFKAIQYMSCGVPFVVSPVGVIQEMVRDGVDGLWATSTAQWVDRLGALLTDPSLRDRLVRSARERAVEKYSVRALAPQWVHGIENPRG
jgi:glycosyltransferase involved in cell wall biosynthesis